MANIINVLPDDLVNKIAAGEVVERPASVVKELIENSLDANARHITIELKQAGFESIRVIDDGRGMSSVDARLALLRHATSKLQTTDDLFRIGTLGFRGEALPSIASVSMLNLVTCEKEAPNATAIEVEAGVIKTVKEVAVPAGTTVTVRELFYNTPARRKFQKSPLAELRQIADVVAQLALSHPGVAFTLINDTRHMLKTHTQIKYGERIREVLGKEIFANLAPFSEDSEELKIRGYLSKPEVNRPNRAQIYLFVNRRPVQSRFLFHAIVAGYGDLLPKGRFPVALIYVSIKPELVDVNVHPTKNEVRFANERLLHHIVQAAVTKTVQTETAVKVLIPAGTIPTVIPEPQLPQTIEPPIKDFFTVPFIASGTDTQNRQPGPGEITKATRPFQPDLGTIKPVEYPPYSTEAIEPPTETLKSSQPLPSEDYQIRESSNFWQFADVYIISQVKGSLIVVDQHTAHERVLYEEALRNLDTKSAHSQQLLFPISLELTPIEYATFVGNADVLAQLGFDVRPFGERTVLIGGIPTLIRGRSPEKFLREVLDDLAENLKAGHAKFKAVARAYACKAAVKAGDRLTPEEMSVLFDQLFATQNPYACPHGRPTIIRIPVAELNKKFGR